VNSLCSSIVTSHYGLLDVLGGVLNNGVALCICKMLWKGRLVWFGLVFLNVL
jgi:hypothetical protein